MTTPLVVFPDVEADLADFYRDGLAANPASYTAGVQVHVRTPASRPAVLVTVRAVGGAATQFAVDYVRFDVQVWHTTDVDCHDLAELVRGLSWQARGFRGFRGMRESARPVPAPDTDGTPRYLFTPEFTVKGATP